MHEYHPAQSIVHSEVNGDNLTTTCLQQKENDGWLLVENLPSAPRKGPFAYPPNGINRSAAPVSEGISFRGPPDNTTGLGFRREVQPPSLKLRLHTDRQLDDWGVI